MMKRFSASLLTFLILSVAGFALSRDLSKDEGNGSKLRGKVEG